MNELMELGLFEKKEKILVSSRVIAEKFDKRHTHILDSIKGTIKEINSAEKTAQLFIDSTYKDASGKTNPEYLLTRDGFSLLVMGFTGSRALDWKLKYIEAFNTMEAFIREKLSTEWQEIRIKGKLVRKDETDVIMAKLIPLAISQGSKNAGKLYMTYSKLINSCINIPPNSRDKVTKRVLDVICNLEHLIENVIKEESEKGTYYKDIYQICKGKCKLFVELSYLPKVKMIA